MNVLELERHRRELTGYCQRMVGAADAEDIVQETMLRAWHGLAAFDGRSGVRPWLYRIAGNACLDVLRRRERWGRLEPRLRASAGQVSPEDPAEVAVNLDDVRRALAALLGRLNARQRAALILCDVLRWQSDEAAEALGISPVAVRSSLQRARTALARPSGGRGDVDPGQLDRYLDAFRRYDFSALTEIIRLEAGVAA